jgi:hypothetical protein
MKWFARNRQNRWRVVAAACAGILLYVTGCDSRAQEILVTGMNEAANQAATTLLDSVFIRLLPEEETTALRVVEGASTMLA